MTWTPSKKWITALITGIAGIAASWIVTGTFDDVERGMAATLLTTLAASYFKTNDPAPNGEAGQALIELCFALLLLVLVIWVLTRLF